MFLYYITDRKQLSTDHDDSLRLLLERIRQAAKTGIDAIQLREKDLSTRALLDLARKAAEILSDEHAANPAKAATKLLINSRIDIALACGANGVHLPSTDVSAADARAVFMQAGAKATIAVSCHSQREVELAEGHGANFAVFGTVISKAGAALAGIDALRKVCRERQMTKSPMPVIALGGVDLSNADDCIQAGAAGVAGIRLFQNGDMKESAELLRRLRT